MAIAASRYQAELRLVVRTITAAGAAYLIAETLGLPQGFWAVVTALIVVQGSLGGTIAAGADRFLGTLAGAVLGAAADVAGKFLGVHQAIVIVLTVAPLAFLASIRPSFKIAPVTAVIVLLATPSDASPVMSALLRVGEIALGTIIGIAVSSLVLPSRARRIYSERSAAMLKLLGDALELHLQPSDTARRTAIERLNDQTRAELGRIGAAAAEARRERAMRLSDEPDQDHLLMTLRRLRSDVAFVGRATAGTDLDWDSLREVFGEVATAFRGVFDALCDTLLDGKPVPDLAAVDQAMAKLRLAVSQEPGRSDSSIVLPFIFETLRRDLGDLVDALVRSEL